jgi:phosphoribosylanthranilate isomerase
LRVEIKFCGLTRPEDASAAATLGAAYVGVVFAGGPRHLDAGRASEVLSAAGEGVKRVGVFGASEPAEVARVARVAGLDVVQLHGDPDAEYVRRVRGEFGGVVWAVVRVAAGSLALRVAELDPEADAIVLDSLVTGRLGGTGSPFDWQLVADGARPRKARLVAAGGLAAHNVGEAIRVLAPHVVDVSSGVESSPGIKDHQRMRAFADAVRRHDEGP